MNLVAFAALLSHWRRKPLQLLTLVMGITLATALWSGVQAINAEARASYARASSVLEQGSLRQIVAKEDDGIATAVYGRLRRAGLNISPVIEGNYRFGPVRIRMVGIEPLTMPRGSSGVTIAKRCGALRLLFHHWASFGIRRDCRAAAWQHGNGRQSPRQRPRRRCLRGHLRSGQIA